MKTTEGFVIRAGAGVLALVLGMPAAGWHSAGSAARSGELSAVEIFGSVRSDVARTAADGVDDDREQREEDLYESGTDAIDEEHWQQAVEKFDQVAKLHGKKADAALYWKAWAQNKLGQRTAALTTLEELKRTAPQSRWVADGKALEIEIRQSSSQPVSPDTQSDCELKLLAINGLQQMDPERAVPMLEKMLHGSACPKLRGQALFVLAQSNSTQAREIIAKAARTSDDPELQRKAIQDLGLFAGEWGRQQLSEIYATAKETETKKRIMQAFMVSGDRAHLLAAAKGEADPTLRAEAIQQLGVMGAREDIWQLYEKETSVEVKKKVLQAMWISGDMDHVVQLAKAEKDHDLRMAAIHDLGLMGDKTGDTLVAMYAADPDRDVRRAVIQGLFLSGNAKALVTLARKETDPEMKRAIVRQLSLMQSKEATDYLMEILNK
jgi:HEAT repeat protein